MCREPAFESATGTYALILRIPEGPRRVRVGALGEIAFAAGYYCYVGSALGGLSERLARHSRKGNKRMHWHVDYLREVAEAVGAIVWPTRRRAECTLSGLVARRSDGEVARFGASDCTCRSHLYRFGADPRHILMKLELAGTPGRWAVAHAAVTH